MSNLFSVFDPKSLFNLSFNWLSALVVLILPTSLWVVNNKVLNLISSIVNFVLIEFKSIMPSWTAPGSLLAPISLFLAIVINNFIGLFPYIFTSSSHLVFTVSLALPLWLGHMIFGWLNATNDMLAHLVPLGTPAALIIFMVLIELIRNIIRPLTLSVRLAANIIAGHLLLNLLGRQAPSSPYGPFVGLIVAIVLLGILELGVALIQAYVFSVLRTLYFNEVNNRKFEY